jgi:hypothetical protein
MYADALTLFGVITFCAGFTFILSQVLEAIGNILICGDDYNF